MPATCIFEVNKMGSKEFSFSGLKPQTNYTVIKEIYDKFCDPGRHKAIHYWKNFCITVNSPMYFEINKIGNKEFLSGLKLQA